MYPSFLGLSAKRKPTPQGRRLPDASAISHVLYRILIGGQYPMAIIYLRHFCLPDHHFNLLGQAPLPKFGLPARGVYRVPPVAFL